VFSYLKKRLSDDKWSEDVFQMVFTKLHRTRHQYKAEFRFDQWIFVMTKTVLLDFWKTTGVKTNRYFSNSIDKVPLADLPMIVQPEVNPLNVLTEPIFANLSPDQKMILELKFIDELSYNEIANQLSRSQESVRQIVSRAIKSLRKKANKSQDQTGGTGGNL
jgi:RNA polymerase sigma-70 factor (ECF subfamily)